MKKRCLFAALWLVSTLCAQEDLKSRLAQAIASEKAGDKASAVLQFRDIADSGASLDVTGQARLELLRIYQGTAEWWKALEQVEQLRALAPRDPEYAYQAGVIYRHLSHWAFDRMKTATPETARYQQALGEEYSATGEWDKAAKAFEKAAAADTGLSGPHLALAMIRFRAGERERALAEVDLELAIAPESAIAKQIRAAIEGSSK